MKLMIFILIVALLIVPCSGSVFDYGIATKGPLNIKGMVVDGVSIHRESDVYIESLHYDVGLEIIRGRIGGEVEIVNPDASVFLLGPKAGIGGEVGQDAIDHHVEFGVPMQVFPYPDTAYFTQYLSGERLTDPYPSGSSYQNITIAAGTNPHFTYNVQLRGIIYIEQPNNVTFSGNVDITGIIVGAGDPLDNSAVNTIIFQNGITSHDIATLDDSFGRNLKDETGTFLIAPGFKVRFAGDGNFGTIYGCIAANGVDLYGIVEGTIIGSVLNYSDEPMIWVSPYDIYFNRSGITSAPAGLDAPIFKLYTANGGENLISGEEFLIRWFGNVVVHDVLIEYSVDNGLHWLPVEDVEIKNTGLYRWLVPAVNSSECLVRISGVYHPSISDVSDAPFTISPPYACDAYLPMDFNEDCKVDLLDFAVFVEHWMECHREPIEACYQ